MGVTCGLTRMPDNPEIWKAAAMADQFDKMQKLPDPLPGCPNFHRIPGYKVYTCGQPICARPPNKIGEYAELGAVTRDLIKADEAEFFKVVEGRVKENGGKLKYVTISKEEKEVEVKELTTLSEAMLKAKEDFPGLVHWRVPVCNSASPLETDFDIICNTLVGTSINTPVIVTDQVGLSRATTGSVIACLFKEFQINASFEGLVETVPGVNLDLLKMDKYTMDPSKDPLFRGEFPVVLALLEKLKGGKEAKNECDKVIHDIYQTAHIMFSDMPQGDHKKRAKYRFASKTLMRILPPAMSKEIESKIEEKAITLDLYEILGKCTWTPV